MKFIKYRDMSRDAKQLVWIYGTLAVLLTAMTIGFTVYMNTPVSGAKSDDKTSSEVIKESEKPSFADTSANEPTEVVEPTQTPQNANKGNTAPIRQAPVERVSEQTRPTESVPAKTEPLERIPFTNKPVTPGVPESYIDTYGQCPFYEGAGEKGCVPPPDIQCNADWSVCEYIGTRFEP